MNSPDPNRTPGPDAEALAAQVHAALRELPHPPAPASLAVRVLGTLEARGRQPWWQNSWWEWPLGVKAAFLFTALGLAAVFGSGSWFLDEGLARYSGRVSEALSSQGSIGDLGTTLWDAAALLWSEVGQPRLLAWLGIIGLLYAVCVGLGTAFLRTASRRG